MNNLINTFEKEKTCQYRGETYSVRDNGAVKRHAREGKKLRSLDEVWTFGTINTQKGYLMIAAEPIHRIVATAFLGEPPTKSHVVDHIDTNRQNNRPENLRWVTRLENIVLNDITRKKLELLCDCSIDEILSDMSVLRDKPLTPQFNWMKTVSKEEAEKSLATWKAWVADTSKRKEYDRNAASSFTQKSGTNAMNYPLEPGNEKATLDDYCRTLRTNKVFAYKDYGNVRATYRIIEYYLNRSTGILSVATGTSGGIKPYYLTEVTIDNDAFVYNTRSFFSPESLDKYMTLAKGEEWTGGEVFDDYC